MADNAELEKLRQYTLIVYILQAVGVFLPITALAAVIMNYIKRDEVQGTIYQSHFDWQIRTFWWALGLSIVGGLTVIIGLGLLVLAGLTVWYLYRVIKGLVRFNDGRIVG